MVQVRTKVRELKQIGESQSHEDYPLIFSPRKARGVNVRNRYAILPLKSHIIRSYEC